VSNIQIADRLGVALETVRSHMKRIFAKLGVSSRVQAVMKVRGYRSGNIEGPDLTATGGDSSADST
jgi:hypothetical protein